MSTIDPHEGKRYLSDGAYLIPGSYLGEWVLVTENGLSETNRVVLDQHAITILMRVWKEQGF